MFRSKKDVERHVLDVLSKIDNENEKNLRGYTFARLFFQVKDFEGARKYLSGFLSVRDHHAPAHKLMAQIYEATNNPESSLQSYKRSLEIDSHQSDIVLKICELYCQLPVDHETARYWADRAEQIYPHNDIVFKLRECLVSAEGDPDYQELENLIATELAAQPKNIDLRIKLLRLYLDTERVKEAYDHATLIESKQMFLSSDDWYYMLADIFEAYQEEFKQDLGSQFFINYLTALDHLIFLNLSEPHSHVNGKKSPSLNDAADVLFLFDKYLKRASEKDIKDGSWTYFIHHMKGQLFYYMVSTLLKKAKMDQGNRKEALRFSAGLALVCYTIKPMNLLQEIWFSQMIENQKVFTNFFQQGSLRTSYMGHIIKNMCKEEKSKWLQKMKTDVCISQVKERVFNRIFSSVVHKKNLSESFFILDTTFENSSLEFPNDTALKEYDKSAYKLCSASLHHLVWLELHRSPNHGQVLESHLTEIFKGLQYNNKNISKGSCESLCVLDVEAYLCASVYQAEAEIEKRKTLQNNWNRDMSFPCPPDIADAMCSKQQAEWWRSAHGLHSCTIKEKLGESRRVLQHGLEIIRGIGNHGMEVQLVVHLARSFGDKADSLQKDVENLNVEKKKILPENISALQQRAIHYWNISLGILEKLMSGGGVKIPKERMFIGLDQTLSKTEVRVLQEDGQLYLSVRLMESEKLNEAADMLSKLSSPYGSFYLALTLKKFASQEEKFSNERTMFLTRAKNAIHETMDRIKDDKGHPLNREIHMVLEDIENELGPVRSISNGNEDADEVDSYDASSGLNSSVYTTPSSFKSTLHSTPKPSSNFLPKTSKLHISNNDHPKHFEPSPERLDAQIRALALNQDTVIKTIMEQNKSLLETNKCIVDTLQRNCEVLSELKKQLEELKISDTKNSTKASNKKSHLRGQGDEEYEHFDPNHLLEFYEENAEDYRSSSQYERTSRMVQEAAASLNYSVQAALPPGHPPSLNHYNYQYPPHAMLPTAPVPERPQFYHPAAGQSLPFSEGQQLPQFHFHVASPVVKPTSAVLSHMSSIPQNVTLPPPPPPPLSMQQPPLITQPSSGQLPMTGPWTKPVGVPHAFQIPLPPSATFTSSSNFASQSAAHTSVRSAVTSQSTLKNLLTAPTPAADLPGNISAVPTSTPSGTFSIFSGISKTPARPRYDSDTAGSPEVDGHDLEREVMGDFTPLIPLPAEIVVETGEEDEMVLFEDRAKLYRFVDQEWKERGLGIVKILYHDGSKRVRLLMRRDQVYKVCANHYITSQMEVKPLKTSDRAWTWCAQDFADEELRPEQFCIRFKTSEVALNFKIAFDKAINIAKDCEIKKSPSPHKPVAVCSPSTQKTFGTKFLPKSGSWSCPTCYVSNTADKLLCVACTTNKPGYISDTTSVTATPVPTITATPFTSNFSFKIPASSTNQFTFGTSITTQSAVKSSPETDKSGSVPKSVFGGFTFSTSPTILETADLDASEREILVVSTKSKNGPQVSKVSSSKTSPFSGFSFTSPPSLTTKPSTFLTSDSNIKLPAVAVNKSKSEVNSAGGSPFVSTSTSTATTQSSISKELFPKETESSKSSHFSSFSLKPSVFSSNVTPVSTQSPCSADFTKETSVSKIQSMVQNISPAFVFSPKSSVNATSSPANQTKKSTLTSGTLTFSPIATNDVGGLNLDKAPEEFVPTAEFKPVVPLPALVDVKTGEEEEEQKFCHRAKLFRFDSETKEWKERGIGELKILYLRDSKKYRILMRRDLVLKICANHNILPEMKLTPLAKSDRAWVWFAQDFSENDLVQENFAVKFKTVEIAKEFFSVFEKCQMELINLEKEVDKIDSCQGNKDTFDKLLVPATNSWQCSKCQQYNSNQSSCVYCKTPISKISGPKPMQNKDQAPLSELFKPAENSWECSQCYAINKSTDSQCVCCVSDKSGLTNTPKTNVSSTNEDKTLAEMFKPTAGSWTCETCLLSNSSNKYKCAACETPKPGSSEVSSASDMPSSFQRNTPAFSFGSNTSSSNGFLFGSKPAAQPSTFTFGQTTLTKVDQVFGFKPSLPTTGAPAVFGGTIQKSATIEQNSVSITPVTAAPTYVFGSSNTSNVTFGSLASANTPDEESVEFRFGSPQKYEFSFSGVTPRSPTRTPKSPRSPATPYHDEEADEVEPSDADNIYFTPVIPLPPKVDVRTGEEHESVLFCKRAKLYRFSEGEWKERGLGDIKILFDDCSKRARLLMRREQVLKVCLNHHLTKEIKFDWRGDKSLSWAATDFSENEATPELFAIRFKTAELAQEFKEAIDNATNIIDTQKPADASSDKLKNFSFKLDTSPKVESNFNSSSLSFRFGTSLQEKPIFGNTPEANEAAKPSPFSFSLKDKPAATGFFSQTSFASGDSKPLFGSDGFKFSLDSFNKGAKEEGDDDVEVIYESPVTREKIAAAKALQLPMTFYLYEEKAPCPGCRGCTDTIPPFKDVTEAEDDDIKKDEPAPISEESSSGPFSHTGSTFSFTDLASKTNFAMPAQTSASKQVFAGAGAPIFASINTSADDDTLAENPDIHFEPVIPLPDLVEVKTGEEDENSIFVHRAKLFRFDSSTKQWKERGIGDIKILSLKEKTRFRIILRRDQVHTVACNHCITDNMSLAPLATSDSAVCWNAIDHSDGQPEAYKFAVRFKAKETLEIFKSVFNECLETLRNSPPLIPEIVPAASSENINVVANSEANSIQQTPDIIVPSTESEQILNPENENNEEEHSGEVSEEEDDIIFEKRVSFEIYDEEDKKFKVAGLGILQIIYDDAVYGYRITMVNDQKDILCEHIIAIQNCLRLDGNKAIWSAVDFSVQPSRRRQFRATFSSKNALKEFHTVFEEGKEAAVHSVIVENELPGQ